MRHGRGLAALAVWCAGIASGSRRPVAIAGALVVLVCLGLHGAAAPDMY